MNPQQENKRKACTLFRRYAGHTIIKIQYYLFFMRGTGENASGLS